MIRSHKTGVSNTGLNSEENKLHTMSIGGDKGKEGGSEESSDDVVWYYDLTAVNMSTDENQIPKKGNREDVNVACVFTDRHTILPTYLQAYPSRVRERFQ
jgi:hypothetical protein